jgi:hypothetical protein
MTRNIYHTSKEKCWNKNMTHYAFGKHELGISLEWKMGYPVSFPDSSKCWKIKEEEPQIIYSHN